MEKVWFKFSAGSGSHLLRVKNPGTEEQEVMLDGALVEAPPGTLTFTGPAATLLELQYLGDSQWTLLVDGHEAEQYTPHTGSTAQQVCWWRFGISGTGTHHVRVTDVGLPQQQVWIDGAPLDAPPGTMSFTGPGACLLELSQREDGQWMLLCDGYPLQQHHPANDSGEPSLVWQFVLPSTGHHVLAARHIGKRGQLFYLDGSEVQVPEGALEFTGPGGLLLQVAKLEDDAWHLLAEGTDMGAGLASMEAADAPLEASFTFILPSTGQTHAVQAFNVGRQGQSVFLDGVPVEAPDGTTTFTGPGGSLLELKLQESRWQLFVDNQSIAALSSRASYVPGPLSLLGQERGPVSPEALPQGVSFDSENQRYTANIRVGGRFRNLGLFHSPEEAHQRYLQAKDLG